MILFYLVDEMRSLPGSRPQPFGPLAPQKKPSECATERRPTVRTPPRVLPAVGLL